MLPGRYFQLGAKPANPVGVRKVSNVVVDEANNYNLPKSDDKLSFLPAGMVDE